MNTCAGCKKPILTLAQKIVQAFQKLDEKNLVEAVDISKVEDRNNFAYRDIIEPSHDLCEELQLLEWNFVSSNTHEDHTIKCLFFKNNNDETNKKTLSLKYWNDFANHFEVNSLFAWNGHEIHAPKIEMAGIIARVFERLHNQAKQNHENNTPMLVPITDKYIATQHLPWNLEPSMLPVARQLQDLGWNVCFHYEMFNSFKTVCYYFEKVGTQNKNTNNFEKMTLSVDYTSSFWHGKTTYEVCGVCAWTEMKKMCPQTDLAQKILNVFHKIENGQDRTDHVHGYTEYTHKVENTQQAEDELPYDCKSQTLTLKSLQDSGWTCVGKCGENYIRHAEYCLYFSRSNITSRNLKENEMMTLQIGKGGNMWVWKGHSSKSPADYRFRAIDVNP